jgi:hypothetical protein
VNAPAALAPPLSRAPRSPSAGVAGAYAGALHTLEPDGARGPLARLRRKRWIYAMAVSDEVLAAAAVVDGGWFAGAFAWAADRATGAVVLEASRAGFPGLSARVSDRSGPGAAARFRGPGLLVDIRRDGRGWLMDVETRGAAIEAALEVEPATAPFTFVAAVPGGGVRATEKAGGLPATGSVRAGGRSLSLDGGAGGVDVTAGVLARETRWRWAFGSGRVAGAPLGFNLCEGFGVPAGDPGENAAFRGGDPYRLPPVTFAPGAREWRIASPDGAVDLVFAPIASHGERRNLGVLRTRFTQVAGAFRGRVPGRDGAPLAVDGVPGVVEDHWAVW